MKLLLIAGFAVLTGLTSVQVQKNDKTGSGDSEKISIDGHLKTGIPGPEKIGIPELEIILASPADQLHVVNFWATWCPPCVTELPYFEKLAKEYQGKGVKFILISLDFPSQADSKLIPFLRKNNITADVRLMTNLDYNSWIDKVDPGWQGNLPATLFFNNAKKIKYFHSSEVTEKELKDLITKYKQ